MRLTLAPTASASRWYSKPNDCQEEYTNVCTMESSLSERRKHMQKGMAHLSASDNTTADDEYMIIDEHDRMGITVRLDNSYDRRTPSYVQQTRRMGDENDQTSDLTDLDDLYLSDTQRQRTFDLRNLMQWDTFMEHVSSPLTLPPIRRQQRIDPTNAVSYTSQIANSGHRLRQYMGDDSSTTTARGSEDQWM